MPFFKSLRARLMVVYLVVILIGFGMLFLLAGQQLTASGEAAFRRNTESNASLLAKSLDEPFEHFVEGQSSPADLDSTLANFEVESDGLITIIDPQGRALVGHGGDLPTDDQRIYPEIEAALRGETASHIRLNEVGIPTMYAASPISHEGQTLAALRLEVPTTVSTTETTRRSVALGISVGVVALLALASNFWLAGALTRPLERLRTTALELASGNLAERVPTDGQDELAQLGQAFNHMADQLQAMLDEQRAFVANASHELRTPLAAIKVRSEALAGDTLDKPTRERYVAEVDSEVDRLGRLVEELMVLAQIETGRALQSTENLDLVHQLRAIERHFAPRAERQDVRLNFDLPQDLPPVKVSDGHMRAMLSNLIDNALKYTPEGGQIWVQAFTETTDMVVKVTDSGQGIASEDLPHIFDRFYRADKARTRQVEGSGLGLSIVRTVAEFNGGNVELTSAGIGQGTTVRLHLPISTGGPPV